MATSSKSTNSKHPTPEDKERLIRLSEEITARATEIALILGRAQGKRNVLPSLGFTLSVSATATDSDDDGLGKYRFHEATLSDGSKVCHDFEAQVSCPGPCPCS